MPFLLKLKDQWRPRFEKLDVLTNGALSIFAAANRQFSQNGGTVTAAGLAFYAVFSLFPLLSLAVTVTSLFTGAQQVSRYLLELLSPVFPVSNQLIIDVIERFLQAPALARLSSLLILLWAASGAFTILVYNINQAWEEARPRNFLEQRLIGLTFIAIILALLVLVLLVTTGADLLFRLQPSLFQGWNLSPLWSVGRQVFTFFMTFFIFLLIYRYVPRAKVRYSEALWGALLVSLAWLLISTLFRWFVGRSQGQYDLLYGSLAAITVLMLWIYLNSLMILFGAHLSATVSKRNREREFPVVKVKG